MINSYHVYLSSNRASVRLVAGPVWQRKIRLVGESPWNCANPASLSLELGHRPRYPALKVPLHIYIGSGLSKFLALEFPVELEKPEELISAASAHFVHQLGIDPKEWCLTVSAQPASGKRIACAMRVELMERLRAISYERNVRLVSVKPFINGVWNAATCAEGGEESRALIAVEQDAFTVVSAAGNELVSISSLLHDREINLVEREVNRLRYSFAKSEQTVLLGLAPGCLTPTVRHPVEPMRRGDFLTQELYPDFRDLVFANDLPSETANEN